MGQMKHRFYTLGLSLLVLAIALAGLLAVLNNLPKSAVTDTVNPPPGTGQPAEPDFPTPGGGTTPDFSLSLPDGFSFDLANFTNPGLSLQGGSPPHYPLLEVSGAESTRYLKSITSSYFDGTRWLPESASGFTAYRGQDLTIPVTGYDQALTDTITVNTLADISGIDQFLPASLYPVSVTASTPLSYSPENTTFIAKGAFPEEYQFTTTHFTFTKQMLAEAQAAVEEQYLQLPDNITPRTFQLAQELTGGIASPFYQAKAIEDYLKTNYTYDYEAEPAPSGHEPNDWFLFEEKRGVCTNFNSAFVIMCRAADIPARMAGGFAVAPQPESQTVYADQAHAWSEVKFSGLGWYTFDATGQSSVQLIPTETEITSIAAVATKGDAFIVAGTVWTRSSSKPADGTLVEILVNTTKSAEGAVKIGEGMVSQGFFKIEAVIPGETAVGNYQVLAHSHSSARYAESWSDPAIKVISETSIQFNSSEKVKTGTVMMVRGLLSGEFGEVLGGSLVQISVDGGQAAAVTTDNTGRFTWQTRIDEPGSHVLRITYAGSEYFQPTFAEADFRVLAPAVMKLKTEGNTYGEPVYFSGSLKEIGTDEPLAGRDLTLFINDNAVLIPITTDQQGDFKFDTVFTILGKSNVEVLYSGDDDYAPTGATIDLDIVMSLPFPVWKLIVIILAVAAVGIGGWFLYRRWKTRSAGGALTLAENRSPEEDLEPDEPEAWQSASPGLSLTIELPQITPPLPDVWGIGEPLNITFHLTGAEGTDISGPLEITLDGEYKSTADTSASGSVQTTHAYPIKGVYNISVDYGQATDTRKASAVRPVRVVDYREEIVELFNKLVDSFRAAGIPLNDEYTPRKIQYLVTTADTGIPEKPLEDIITCFEEADYSLHPITRKHYETMYLAQMEIKRHGIKPSAHTQNG